MADFPCSHGHKWLRRIRFPFERWNIGKSLGDWMNGINGRKWRGRHGFMLMMTCVLSLAAFLFAIELTVSLGEAARARPGKQAAGQESSPAQQSRQQPVRAVVDEAKAFHAKSLWPDGAGPALPPTGLALALDRIESAGTARGARRLAAPLHDGGFARAPPCA
ncbi:MAG: hypothetical protein J0H18_03430 [Rhizobiales bacterium]|nr:hypothetical protein [Hyphomicrobiales bacterium]